LANSFAGDELFGSNIPFDVWSRVLLNEGIDSNREIGLIGIIGVLGNCIWAKSSLPMLFTASNGTCILLQVYADFRILNIGVVRIIILKYILYCGDIPLSETFRCRSDSDRGIAIKEN
jgi:hypothetical protein